MQLARIVETSAALRKTRSRLEKTAHLADCLRELEPEEVRTGVAYLCGALPQGRIGVGYAVLREMRSVEAGAAGLTLSEVGIAFDEIASLSGTGSGRGRTERLGALFARAAGEEQNFLARLVAGELRQGASEGLMVEAVARAADVPVASVRRAQMVSGALGDVAAAALRGGVGALDAFSVELFRPLLPMLAQPSDDVEAALDTLGPLGGVAFEFKLDGARIQVHKSGDDVRVFSRRLNDVSSAVPEVVELVRAFPARTLILDGEVLALRPDGAPQPFQVTMRRFGRRSDVARMRETLPLGCVFFDCLRVDEDDLLDRPGSDRVRALDLCVPESARVPRTITEDAEEADAFWRDALERGHEGLMAKSLEAPYQAGSRGKSWLKLKPAHTLDLVVLAAEWGSGRRRGWLSNLHLGARDPSTGGFVMLGKTFKGLTDATLEWQTAELLARELARDDWVVHVKPELVVEIAFNDVQTSPQYPGGVALRFARVKHYRADKRADEADTIDAVRSLLPRS